MCVCIIGLGTWNDWGMMGMPGNYACVILKGCTKYDGIRAEWRNRVREDMRKGSVSWGESVVVE